jgi:hypothetical protein
MLDARSWMPDLTAESCRPYRHVLLLVSSISNTGHFRTAKDAYLVHCAANELPCRAPLFFPGLLPVTVQLPARANA